MRLRLLVKRHELPDTALLWAVDEVQNPTISQILDQINDVIPLESGAEWGLEEYVVELKTGSGSFECLHYMPATTVLKEEDEVVVRPLSDRERRQRKDAGRDQITRDGRHIIDGVAFGGTKRKRIAGRPPVVIPSRKRARILGAEAEIDEEEFENQRLSKALRITQYPHSNEKISSSQKPATQEESFESDSDEEDFVPATQDDNDDFPIDPVEMDKELDAMMVEAGTDKENEAVPVAVLLDEEINTHGHPEIPLEELRAAFPEYPTKVLEHFLSVPNPKIGTIYNALAVGAVAKKPKTAVIRAIKTRIAALSSPGSKEAAQTDKSRSAKTALVETVVPDTAGDEDDDNEEEEEEENDEEDNPDDNGGMFTHGSIDANGKLKDSETRHVKFDVSDNEDDDDFDLETSDSDSSMSSASNSEDEPEIAPTKKAAPAVEDSETSSSGSSDSDSDSSSSSDESSDESSDDSSDSSSGSDASSDSGSGPEQVSSKFPSKATPLNVHAPFSPKPEVKPVFPTVPPGEGRKSTKARNQRRRASNVLQRLQTKGILPAGVTLTEFTKLDSVDDNTTPEEGAAAVAALRALKETGNGAEEKKTAKEAKSAALKAELQAARERMLAQLQGGGIDVSGGGDEADAALSEAAPAQEKRKNKAGAAANRHIFGALGLKVPKNQEEKDAITKELMKDVRPVKLAEPAADVDIDEPGPAAIDDSWKKNISVYRAVETHPDHLDEVYADPEFPFRQKSYISEESLLHPNKRLGKGKRKKSKHQEQYYEGEPAAKKGKQNEEAEPEHDEDEEPNDQLMRDAQEAEEVEEEDLLSLPEDPSTLPTVEPSSLQPGAIIAFQELSMGENWQPVIKWSTACVLRVVPESSEIDIVLALRDREMKEYNEETGERIYGKFEMPQDEDEEDFEDDGVRTKPFAELTELRLVQAAPEDLDDQVAAVSADEDADPMDDDKVTTDPNASTTMEETTTLDQEEPQSDSQELKEKEPVADKDSQQQSEDISLEQEKCTSNQKPDLLASLDATLNASTKETIIETSADVATTDVSKDGAAALLPESGSYSPKFHGLNSFTSNTTIAPSFDLSQTSQVKNAATPVFSAPNSASASQVVDHGQRQPEVSTPEDPTVNHELSQSTISQYILAGFTNANTDDGDDEPVSAHGSTRKGGYHQLADLPSPSQIFSAAKKLSEPINERIQKETNAALSSPTHSLVDNASKSLPSAVNQFASLKDRLASKKGKAPRTKILAKRTSTSRGTKSMNNSLLAKELTHEPRGPGPVPQVDIDANEVDLLVSQSQSQSLGTRQRQFPSDSDQESSSFKVPSGNQQIDLTLSDDEDLRGEVMYIPDAADIDAADEFVDKPKRRSVNRNVRINSHKKKAEVYNRRQMRG